MTTAISETTTANPRPQMPQLSQKPATGWVMLGALVPLGGWLVYRWLFLTNLPDDHFWTMLKTDPIFGFAMLDFFVTAAWAFLVLLERGDPRSWRFWIPALVFMPIPSLGLALFVLLNRESSVRGSARAHPGDSDKPVGETTIGCQVEAESSSESS